MLPGTIALNGVQRKLLRVSTGDSLRVEPFVMPAAQFSAAAMTVELEFTKLRTAADLNAAGRHEQVRPASDLDPGTRSAGARARIPRSTEEVPRKVMNTPLKAGITISSRNVWGVRSPAL